MVFLDACLCDHELSCIEEIEPRLMEDEIFLYLSSSDIMTGVSQLSLFQQRHQVDRIIISNSDDLTWVACYEQRFCVIRTLFDKSFFRWRRRRFTTIIVRGTVVTEQVIGEFEIQVPVRPGRRLLPPVKGEYRVLYIFLQQ